MTFAWTVLVAVVLGTLWWAIVGWPPYWLQNMEKVVPLGIVAGLVAYESEHKRR